jgi:hypothetical protein
MPPGSSMPNGVPVTLVRVMRIATFVLSACVTAAGVLVATGVLSKPGMSSELRVMIGAVTALYGAYKFTVTWFRRPGRLES